MSKLSAAMVAVVFATGVVSGTPAWADRGNYGHGQPPSHSSSGNHRDHGDNGWVIGLGLLAGAAILMAATDEPRPAPPPVQVYSSPPVYSSAPTVAYPSEPVAYPPPPAPPVAYANPTNQWWYYCAQPAGYYPHVQQCPAGWTRVAATPPGY